MLQSGLCCGHAVSWWIHGQHYLDGHCFRTGDTGVRPLKAVDVYEFFDILGTERRKNRNPGIPMEGGRFPEARTYLKELGQLDEIPVRRPRQMWNSFEWALPDPHKNCKRRLSCV